MKTLVCAQLSDGEVIKRYECFTSRSKIELVFKNTIHGWVARAYRNGKPTRLSPQVNEFATDKLAELNV